jgi:hypothetical protein
LDSAPTGAAGLCESDLRGVSAIVPGPVQGLGRPRDCAAQGSGNGFPWHCVATADAGVLALREGTSRFRWPVDPACNSGQLPASRRLAWLLPEKVTLMTMVLFRHGLHRKIRPDRSPFPHSRLMYHQGDRASAVGRGFARRVRPRPSGEGERLGAVCGFGFPLCGTQSRGAAPVPRARGCAWRPRGLRGIPEFRRPVNPVFDPAEDPGLRCAHPRRAEPFWNSTAAGRLWRCPQTRRARTLEEGWGPHRGGSIVPECAHGIRVASQVAVLHHHRKDLQGSIEGLTIVPSAPSFPSAVWVVAARVPVGDPTWA